MKQRNNRETTEKQQRDNRETTEKQQRDSQLVMRLLRGLLLLFFCAASASAQAGTDVFARARRLVNDGDAKAGRALVDSALAAAVASDVSADTPLQGPVADVASTIDCHA